jgi:hypothetical protein
MNALYTFFVYHRIFKDELSVVTETCLSEKRAGVSSL